MSKHNMYLIPETYKVGAASLAEKLPAGDEIILLTDREWQAAKNALVIPFNTPKNN